jgi:hypothetical protein
MRLTFLLALMLLFAAMANAQSTHRVDTSGAPNSIARPNPVNTPSVRDPNLDHIGAVEFWDRLAPSKNIAPSVTRIVGKDLHLALFNYTKKEGKLESSVAFQLKPYVDNQIIEVQIFAVEQNGRKVIPTRMIAPQKIALKKQGAVLPFTVEMNENESLMCEMIFLIDGEERGKAKLVVNSKGLDFAAEKRANKTAN